MESCKLRNPSVELIFSQSETNIVGMMKQTNKWQKQQLQLQTPRENEQNLKQLQQIRRKKRRKFINSIEDFNKISTSTTTTRTIGKLTKNSSNLLIGGTPSNSLLLFVFVLICTYLSSSDINSSKSSLFVVSASAPAYATAAASPHQLLSFIYLPTLALLVNINQQIAATALTRTQKFDASSGSVSFETATSGTGGAQSMGK